MTQLHLQNATFPLDQRKKLNIENLTIQTNDFWAIVGGNGSGKSALAQALCGKISCSAGELQNDFQRIVMLSFEQQQKIMEAIFNDRNNDTVSPDDFGLTARQVILADAKNENLCEEYAIKLGITSLLERPFMQLSTGESRKVLFCQMLVSEPDLLILDEPFEGLDQASQRYWQQLMMEIRKKMTVVLIVNRFGDIPTCATHIALLDSLQLILQGKRANVEQQAVYSQLKFAEENMHASLPGSLSAKEKIEGNPFELENVTIQYGEQKIIDNLTWTMQPQQHWWIKGRKWCGEIYLAFDYHRRSPAGLCEQS